MTSKEPSHPSVDMEEEDESTSGQVHGGRQSTKTKKRGHEREKKEKVGKKSKSLTPPCTIQEIPTQGVSSSHQTSPGLNSGGIMFSGKNPDHKLKLVSGAPVQPIPDMPGQGVLRVEHVPIHKIDHPLMGASSGTTSQIAASPRRQFIPPFFPQNLNYFTAVSEPHTPLHPAQYQDAPRYGDASPGFNESVFEERLYNRLAEDARSRHQEFQESIQSTLSRLLSGRIDAQASSLAGPSGVNVPNVPIPPRVNPPVIASDGQAAHSSSFVGPSEVNIPNVSVPLRVNSPDIPNVPLRNTPNPPNPLQSENVEVNTFSNVAQDDPLRLVYSTVQMLTERMLKMEDRNPPPPPPPTASQKVSTDSLEKTNLLSFLQDYFSAIKPIQIAGKSPFLAYDYKFLWSLGFWKIPEVNTVKEGVCSLTMRKNQIGCFDKLVAPTLLNGYKPDLKVADWTSSTLAGQPTDSQLDQDKESVVDSVSLQVVPGRCLSDPELNEFINAPPLTETHAKLGLAGKGRSISIDSDIFENNSSIKWNTNFIIPSMEYKLRLIAKDGASRSTMSNDLFNRVSSLLANWDSPHSWSKKGIVQEAGNPVPRTDGKLLRESFSAEDFAEELEVIRKQLALIAIQDEHQFKLLSAAHAETKIGMREMVLTPNDDHPKLKKAVRNSRLSTASLFGPIPDPLTFRIGQSTAPLYVKVKSVVNYPAPSAGKPVTIPRPVQKQPNRGGSSAKYRGGRRAIFFNPPARQTQQQHASHFNNPKAPKNSRGGRGAKNPQGRAQRKTRPPSRGRGGRGKPAS